MQKNWHKAAIFQAKTASRLFGLQIVLVATALSFVTLPTHAFDYNLSQVKQVEQNTITTTTSKYAFPLETTLGVSQRFQGMHPGVDYRAPRETKIFSIDDGIVVETGDMFVGYGHFVRIAHSGTLSSLYAHMNKIDVSVGQKVNKGQVIGNVGMTGWTTGPHLHFELHSGEKAINPENFISQ